MTKPATQNDWDNDWDEELFKMAIELRAATDAYKYGMAGFDEPEVIIYRKLKQLQADARKEMVEKVEQEIPRYLKGGKIRNQYFAKGHNECKRDVLAILRKETK